MATLRIITPFKHRLTDEVMHPLYLQREPSYPGMEKLYSFAGCVTADYTPAKDEIMGQPGEWTGAAFSIDELHPCHIFKKGTEVTLSIELTPATMRVGGRYNWKNQPDRLVYVGRSLDGTGGWYQFSKVGDPRPVWCEVLAKDLYMLEETKETP